jgi:hypothetical protein
MKKFYVNHILDTKNEFKRYFFDSDVFANYIISITYHLFAEQTNVYGHGEHLGDFSFVSIALCGRLYTEGIKINSIEVNFVRGDNFYDFKDDYHYAAMMSPEPDLSDDAIYNEQDDDFQNNVRNIQFKMLEQDDEEDDDFQDWIDYIYKNVNNFGIVIPEHLTFLIEYNDKLPCGINSEGIYNVEFEIVPKRSATGIKAISIRKLADIYPAHNYLF